MLGSQRMSSLNDNFTQFDTCRIPVQPALNIMQPQYGAYVLGVCVWLCSLQTSGSLLGESCKHDGLERSGKIHHQYPCICWLRAQLITCVGSSLKGQLMQTPCSVAGVGIPWYNQHWNVCYQLLKNLNAASCTGQSNKSRGDCACDPSNGVPDGLSPVWNRMLFSGHHAGHSLAVKCRHAPM